MSDEAFSIKGTVTIIKNKGRADEKILCQDKPNLLTTLGRDYIFNAIYIDETASKVAASFMGLSSDTSGAQDIATLTGEITTGGLERVNVTTNTHTPGATTATLEHTFTATTTHNQVQKAALFTAVSGGVKVHENTFTPEDLVNTDTLTVTWTITIS